MEQQQQKREESLALFLPIYSYKHTHTHTQQKQQQQQQQRKSVLSYRIVLLFVESMISLYSQTRIYALACKKKQILSERASALTTKTTFEHYYAQICSAYM